MGDEAVKRAVQVTKTTSASNRKGVLRLVSWFSTVIVRIVTMFRIKQNRVDVDTSAPQWVAPATVLNWVAHRIKLVPCKIDLCVDTPDVHSEATGVDLSNVDGGDTPDVHSEVTDVDLSNVDKQVLVKTILQKWKRQMQQGLRRLAMDTMSMLVRATKSARRTLPRISSHLSRHKVKVGSRVVHVTKTWKNPGSSRNARARGTVFKVKDGVAECQFERKQLAYDAHHPL